MKYLQQKSFENDWGRFLHYVGKPLPTISEGYKAGAEQSVQQEAYQKLWDKTKNQLEGLSDETVLSNVSIHLEFTKEKKQGAEFLISSQVAEMLGESGTWEKASDYPKTKFVMKKLTEMGLKINNPTDFIGKKIIIENGKVSILNANVVMQKREDVATLERKEGKVESAEISRRELISLKSAQQSVVVEGESAQEQEVKSEPKLEKKEKSLEEMTLQAKNVVTEFWGLKGFSSISKKINRLGFHKTLKNLSVTTTGGKSALVFDNEKFLLTENAEGILKNLKEAAAMDSDVIENYWDNMARLAVSRQNADKNFYKYEACFFDLPEDVSFKGITKEEHYLIFKQGRNHVHVLPNKNGTYQIMDIEGRTGWARQPIFAKKIGGVFTREELAQWFKKKGSDVDFDLPK